MAAIRGLRVTTVEIARLLEKLGCPSEKSAVLASQLDRRARMDAIRKGISYESALEYLIGLMTRGWAAQAVATIDSPTENGGYSTRQV